MRICYISNPDSVHTRRWLNWFHQRGHDISLIADTPMRQPWAEIKVYNLPDRFNLRVIRYPVWELWVRSILQQWQPQILHAHRVSSAGWLGSFSGFHPFVLTPWGSDLYQHARSSRLVTWLARFAMQRADLVTVNSKDLLLQAIHFGASLEKIETIQWGVDFSIYNPSISGENLRRRLGIGDRPVILSPRAMHPIYNIDSIIQAMPSVLKHVPNTILVLRDYNTDQEYKAEIENLIATLELTPSIRWLGSEPWERNVESYRMANVAVSIPSSDGTPVSVLECMACGIPVIASDLPSLREWIEPNQNGYLVPVGDPEGLADAITKFLTDRELSAVYAQRALDTVRTRADHQQAMEKMEELYFSLVD